MRTGLCRTLDGVSVLRSGVVSKMALYASPRTGRLQEMDMLTRAVYVCKVFILVRNTSQDLVLHSSACGRAVGDWFRRLRHAEIFQTAP